MIRLLLLVTTAILAASLFFSDTLNRAYVFLTIDNQAKLQQRLSEFHLIFASRPVQVGKTIDNKLADRQIELPESFTWADQQLNTAQYLTATHTDGIMVLLDGEVVHQAYFGSFTPTSQHISWSLSKSIVSLLFGQAEQQGFIQRQDTVSQWLPELADSAYSDVTMLELLQMSSGIHFSEDYSDPNSDINRLGKTIVLEGSIIEFLQAFERSRERSRGEYQYVSADTQVLAMAIVQATGRTLTELTQDWLWQPLGMQSSGYWLVDRYGYELGFGGFNATLADYARLVDLVGNQGRWHGKQIVPAQYIEDISTLVAKDPNNELLPGWRYGLHWWLPESGGVLGIGVYNQFIYSNRITCDNGESKRLSIAKLSSDGAYAPKQQQDFQFHVALFEQIAVHVC
ncbi:serine hydrolase domain-containing protein [Salinibius halmophilus]|uniref:serine hydrolase domain-containing protein n=1 Tax=Salinibius halmophilus TaxID=1853216 RepID=UPI001314A510|nr:serine hydrolase [Salinibius halmophilus]